jgi:hypothetical protein
MKSMEKYVQTIGIVNDPPRVERLLKDFPFIPHDFEGEGAESGKNLQNPQIEMKFLPGQHVD